MSAATTTTLQEMSPLCCPLFLNGSMLTVTGLMFVFPRIFTKIASKSQQKFSAQTDVGVTSCFSPDLVITISILDSKDLITPVGRFGIWTSKAVTVVALELVECHVRYTICVNLIYQAERWYGWTKPNPLFPSQSGNKSDVSGYLFNVT